ncbi:hypothetical protein C3L33_14393, partial [Rhododendron williamsianum]
ATEEQTGARRRSALKRFGDHRAVTPKQKLASIVCTESSTRSSGSTARTSRSGVSGPTLTLAPPRANPSKGKSRDLKPANVLLDDDMEARIADFGFAKPIADQDTHMTTSNVAGTLGYIAPEYHQTMSSQTSVIYLWGVAGCFGDRKATI